MGKVVQRNFRKYMQLRTWGWFIIIQKTKPLIGQQDPGAELLELEQKAKEAYGAYEEALNVTKELEAANVRIKEEQVELTKQLESEQGNLSQYQERQAKAAAMKADTEARLEEAQKALGDAEVARQACMADKKVMEGEI